MFAFIKMEPRYPWHQKNGAKFIGGGSRAGCLSHGLGVWSPGFDVTRCDHEQVI